MHREANRLGADVLARLGQESRWITRRFRSLDTERTRHALTMRRKLSNMIRAYWTFPWEHGPSWNENFGAARFVG